MVPKTHEQYIEITNRRAQHIKKVALKLFANEGYHSTTISEIAKHTAISKGLIYHYYKSKEELLKAIILEGFEPIRILFNKYNTEHLSVTDFQLFIKTIFSLIENNVLYLKLFFRIILNHSNVNLLLVKELRNVVQPISKSLTNFFRKKGIYDPEIETKLFLSTLLGIAIMYQSSLKNFSLDELQDILVRKYNKN